MHSGLKMICIYIVLQIMCNLEIVWSPIPQRLDYFYLAPLRSFKATRLMRETHWMDSPLSIFHFFLILPYCALVNTAASANRYECMYVCTMYVVLKMSWPWPPTLKKTPAMFNLCRFVSHVSSSTSIQKNLKY